MKVFNKIILGLAATTMLVGCSNLKKVSFADFKAEVEKIEKHEYKKVEVNGYTKMGDAKEEESATYEGDELKAFAASFMIDAYALAERKGATYYVGDGFKIEAEDEGLKGYVEFDKYGYVTKTYSSGEVMGVKCEEEITLKWSD